MIQYRNRAGQRTTCFAEFQRSAFATAQLIRSGLVNFPFESVNSLSAYLQTLPQSDDEGDMCAGHACNTGCVPAQRQRFLPPDPNCWERAFAFAVLSHLIYEPLIITDDFVRIGGTVRRHCWVTYPDGRTIEMYNSELSKRERA